MIEVPISWHLTQILTSQPPAAAQLLILDTRRQQVQVVATYNEVALQSVRRDGGNGPALMSILETKRLQRLLGQAIDACGRVIDPRQIELPIEAEDAA